MAKKSKRPKRSARVALSSRQVSRLRASIKVVRQHFTGFDPKHGYSLSSAKLAKLTPARQKKLQYRARELRRELAAPHKVVKVPRNIAARRALYKHTGAEKVRGRKTFVVHTARPENTEIKIVGTKGRKRIREVRKVAGAEVEQQYFYFADYSKRQPRTMKEISRLTKRILKDMPPGRYVFLSKEFGHISTAMDRDDLLEQLRIKWHKYDFEPDHLSDDVAERKDSRGMAESLIGFSFVATTVAGSRREYAQRLSRRQRMRVAAHSGKSVFRRKGRQR